MTISKVPEMLKYTQVDLIRGANKTNKLAAIIQTISAPKIAVTIPNAKANEATPTTAHISAKYLSIVLRAAGFLKKSGTSKTVFSAVRYKVATESSRKTIPKK